MAESAPPGDKSNRNNERLILHFIDVGHGDACLIQCPDGATILVDAGSGYDYGRGSETTFVIDYLKKVGVRKLDLVIATHPHSDHVGMLGGVLKEFSADLVLDPGKTHTTSAYRRFLEAVRANENTRYKLARAGQNYRFGDVTLKIFYPTDRLRNKINDCSIVFKLQYGKFSALFTGDAEAAAEGDILRAHLPVKSTLLKVGHHGSSSSTTAPFLSAVAPEIAVISCRAPQNRRYHMEVERRLKSHGVKVYRTDAGGTIIMEVSPTECRIRRADMKNE
jgi:competence protein ComEC